MVRYFISLLLSIFLVCGIAYADPSRPIAKAMETPVSVFDMFLYEISERFSDELYRVRYDFTDNLITIEFTINKDHSTVKGFKEANEEQRKKILTKAVDSFGILLKLTINNFQIRHGWQAEDFLEQEFRDEVSKRTVISVTLDDYEKDPVVFYTAKKDHHGNITYKTGTSKIRTIKIK